MKCLLFSLLCVSHRYSPTQIYQPLHKKYNNKISNWEFLVVCVKKMLLAVPSLPQGITVQTNNLDECAAAALRQKALSSARQTCWCTCWFPGLLCQSLTTVKPSKSETGPDPEEDLVDYSWHKCSKEEDPGRRTCLVRRWEIIGD